MLRALQIDLLTRLAIIKLVIKLISQLPRRFIIVGSWIQSRGVNLGPTRRRHGREHGRGGRPLETKFLQPSIWLRYNYYVQLVATRRNWMRVTNLNLAKGGGKLVVQKAVFINSIQPLI